MTSAGVVRRLALALLAVPMLTIGAQTTIGTPPAVRQIGMFSSSNVGYASVGQSITVPALVSSLDSFSFLLNPHGSTSLWNPNILFRAYVMGWDAANEHAAGPVLWESATQRGTGPFNFVTGGVRVASGESLIVFLSTTPVLDQMQGVQYGALLGYGFDDYAPGRFYSISNGADFGAVTTDRWLRDLGCSDCDAAFTATFSSNAVVVPEPSTYVLMAIGLLAMTGAVRSKRP